MSDPPNNPPPNNPHSNGPQGNGPQSENPYQSSNPNEPAPRLNRSPSKNPSVFDEPHLRQQHFQTDERDSTEQPIPDAAASLLVGDDQVEHGVWDEPGLSPSLAGSIPQDALTYDRWLGNNIARTTREATWRNTLLVALAAGPWSILGALAAQMTSNHRSQVLLACIVAPVSEEIMKAAASLWVIEKRPFLFSSKSQILLAAAISGLCFAAIENVMYLNVGLRAPTPGLAAWRWTICTMLHVTCAMIAGLGLAKVWHHTMTQYQRPQLSLATPYFFAAMILHGLYNLGATLYAFRS